jgi:hypothetical protein
MKIDKLCAAIWLLLSIAAYGSEPLIKNGMSLLKLRQNLFANGWQPLVIRNDKEPLAGDERRLLEAGLVEIQSCSVGGYQLHCDFNYKKGNKCIGITTVGEEPKHLKIEGWGHLCPDQIHPLPEAK